MEDVVGSRVYCCFKCRTIVTLHDDIVDKNFKAGNGRAFLFSHAMNVFEGPAQDRQLLSGVHTVADVYCSDCKAVLGWKYIKTYRQEHKFKEGKTVFPRAKFITKAVEFPSH